MCIAVRSVLCVLSRRGSASSLVVLDEIYEGWYGTGVSAGVIRFLDELSPGVSIAV